jgi:hypothetical protein
MGQTPTAGPVLAGQVPIGSTPTSSKFPVGVFGFAIVLWPAKQQLCPTPAWRPQSTQVKIS